MVSVETKSSSAVEFLWILVSVLAVTWLYCTLIRPWRFFAKYRVKYDLGVPPFGSHYRQFFGYESWHETLKRLYYQFPNERFVGMHEIGGRPEYLIRDPELVKQITIRDFNSFVNRIDVADANTDPIMGHKLTNLKTNDWRRVRNKLTPLFTGQKLKQLVVPALNTIKSDMITYLNDKIEQSNKKELLIDMMDLSIRSAVDSFCLTAFDLRTDSFRGRDYGFYDASQSLLKHMNTLSSAHYWAILKFPWIMKHLFGKTLSDINFNSFFERSCKDIADNRISNQINRTDYLQLLQVLREKKSDVNNDDNSPKGRCTFISIDFCLFV